MDVHGNNVGVVNNDDAGATAVVGEDGDDDEIDDNKDNFNNKRWKKNYEWVFFIIPIDSQ